MRNVVSGIKGQSRADVRVASGDRLNTLAVYGTFVLIAAVVFGTLSYHPF